MSRQNPTVIIALGGNAISPKNETGNIEEQFTHTRESLDAVMHFVKERYNIYKMCDLNLRLYNSIIK